MLKQLLFCALISISFLKPTIKTVETVKTERDSDYEYTYNWNNNIFDESDTESESVNPCEILASGLFSKHSPFFQKINSCLEQQGKYYLSKAYINDEEGKNVKISIIHIDSRKNFIVEGPRKSFEELPTETIDTLIKENLKKNHTMLLEKLAQKINFLKEKISQKISERLGLDSEIEIEFNTKKIIFENIELENLESVKMSWVGKKKYVFIGKKGCVASPINRGTKFINSKIFDDTYLEDFKLYPHQAKYENQFSTSIIISTVEADNIINTIINKLVELTEDTINQLDSNAPNAEFLSHLEKEQHYFVATQINKILEEEHSKKSYFKKILTEKAISFFRTLSPANPIFHIEHIKQALLKSSAFAIILAPAWPINVFKAFYCKQGSSLLNNFCYFSMIAASLAFYCKASFLKNKNLMIFTTIGFSVNSLLDIAQRLKYPSLLE